MFLIEISCPGGPDISTVILSVPAGMRTGGTAIKQTLQLADFLGTSENTIKWQIWIALLTYLLLRLVAWIGEWESSFRRFYTLVKGMLWSQRSLCSLIKLLETEENETSPPIRLSAVQMQFDFGNI